MANPFRNKCRIADPESYPGSKAEKTLSIEFLPDGFVFSLMDTQRYKYLALEAFEAEEANNIAGYTEHLAGFFREHPLLAQPFAKTVVSVYSHSLVLTPDSILNGDNAGEIFSTCAHLPDGHCLKTEPLHIMDASGIYTVPKALEEFCKEVFPGCQFRSYGASMIKNVLSAQTIDQWRAEVIIHIKKSHAEILLLNHDKLSFYRSFSITCFDDLLYYLFYVLEQYDKQADDMEAIVIGELPMDNPNFDLLASFFKKLTLPSKNDVFLYSSLFASIPDHYYFNLLNLNTCE